MGAFVPLLLAASLALPPLSVTAERDGATVAVNLRLETALPASMEAAVPSGASVRVVYRLEIFTRRRLWWDNQLWKGEVIASTAFDPVTGRYRCQLLLDDLIVASRETTSAEAARAWLTVPPPIRIVLPASRKRMFLRSRAVFSSSTTWLVFPSVEGTEWVEVPVEGSP